GKTWEQNEKRPSTMKLMIHRTSGRQDAAKAGESSNH
ncbi:MAG: hypothetical protein ACI92C_002688, partial [Neolewinella sp.]